MNAVQRFIGLFRDSPTYGRDRANLISGFGIGTAGVLLNAAVLALVMPLLLDPNSREFRLLTENGEFGQLMALVLLGGATAFATVLIPFRLASVFWGPRIGRYFDQVVLSGITPLRFVIGKVTSQNLFLGLILFLLLPYLVLSLTLGGVHPGVFLAGLFLVWLYCIALALVTLWLSLYLNELLAAVLVIASAAILAGFGCVPLPIQSFFAMTPAPALVQPVYASIPELQGRIPASFVSVFVSCAGCMTAVIGVSLFAISLGPLFGFIRENSTFGEVVRAGDSRRKRWFRLRPHIQRPSELAFFYENRGDAFRRNEGCLRWGIAFCGLALLAACADWTCVKLIAAWSLPRGVASPIRWWIYEFHAFYLTIHGCGLVLAMLVFSHGMNTTYLRLPFVRGRSVEVSRLDTRAFVLFVLVSTVGAILTAFLFERHFALPAGGTIFPDQMWGGRGRPVDYLRITVEGSLAISIVGIVVYAFHRYACLMSWLRSVTLLMVAGVYFGLVCVVPMLFLVLFSEVRVLREIPIFADLAPVLAMVSPLTLMMFLFHETGPLPRNVSTFPFYLLHGVLFILAIRAIRQRGGKLRELYLQGPKPNE